MLYWSVFGSQVDNLANLCVDIFLNLQSMQWGQERIETMQHALSVWIDC